MTNSFQCPRRPPLSMMMNSALKNISTSWKNQSAVAWNQWSTEILCVRFRNAFFHSLREVGRSLKLRISQAIQYYLRGRRKWGAGSIFAC